MAIKYVSWYYGRLSNGEAVHLIRLKNGQGILWTTKQCRAKGLVK